MNKYIKLIKNTGLFAIANFGSKILSFIMLPLYSYVLSTAEFGTVDIYLTTLNLLLPIVSLSIFDAVFRFVIGAEEKNNKIEYLQTGITFSLICAAILCVVTAIISAFLKSEAKNLLILTGIVIFQMLITCLQQYARAVDKVKIYSISSVLYTFLYLFCNILLLVVFRMGVLGYLLSYLIANMITIIYLASSMKNVLPEGTAFRFSLLHLKEMLAYCIPLIPNALLLWVMTASNRYFILYFCDVESNGLYAVANKIPTILSVVTSVFFQAWQLSAIDETKEENSSFSGEVYNAISIACFLISSVLIAFSEIIIKVFMSESYHSSWVYIPMLLAAIVFQSYSSFYGTIYIAYKKTKAVLLTSALGAVINIAGNVILMPRYGVTAACFTTMVSFLVVWLIRVVDTKKYYKVKINEPFIALSTVILCLQVLVINLNKSFVIQASFILLSVAVTLFLQKETIKSVLNKIKKRSA